MRHLRVCVVLLMSLVGSVAFAQAPRLVAQQGHVYQVNIAVMAPDGRTLATLGDDRWVVWEAATGRELMRLTPDEQGMELVGFATDGRFLITLTPYDEATGRPMEFVFWDVAAGAIAEPQEPDGVSLSDALGEEWIAAAIDTGPVLRVLRPGADAIEVAHIGTTRPVERIELEGLRPGIESASFADQRYALSAYIPGGGIQMWDSRTGALLLDVDTPLWSVFAADRVGTDWAAVAGMNRDAEYVVLIYEHGELAETIQLDEFLDERDSRLGMELGPQGRYLRVPGYNIWDLEEQDFLDRPRNIVGTGFIQDRPVFFVSEWNTVTAPVDALDAVTEEVLQRYEGRTMGAARGNFDGEGRLALGSWEQRGVVWDLVTGRETERSVRVQDWVIDAVTSGDTLVVATTDGTVAMSVGGEQQAAYRFSVRNNNDLLGRLSAIHNGRMAYETADSLRILDLNQEAATQVAWDPAGRRQAAILPDGSLRAVFGGDVLGTVGDSIRPVMDDPDVMALALSRSGQYMLGARAANDTLRAFLRDLSTGNDSPSLIGLADTVNAQFISELAVSSRGTHVAAASSTRGWLWDAQTGELRHQWTWPQVSVNTFLEFSPDGRHLMVMSVDDIGARVYDLQTGAEKAVLVSFVDGTWAVATPEGRFDASNGGAVDGLHWVVGLETIDLDQLKARYYEPGLLSKLLGFSDEPLRQIEGIGEERLGLHPAVETLDAGEGQFRVRLVNRGGGIGPVQVLLNGREAIEDARPEGTDPWAESLELALDLSDHPFLSADAENRVTVITRNAEGFLSGRGVELGGLEVEEGDGTPPALWAVVVGAGDYAGNALDLRFAAKDAADFGTALRVASENLFGPENTHVTILAGGDGASTSDGLPTRTAVLDALAEIAASAQPDDLVVLYLAGHGTVTGGEGGDFHYLTRDALSADLSDSAVRQRVAISSDELTEALLAVPALKQLLILDTCHSGAAVSSFSEERTVPGSQIRALDRMKDRSGLYVIAGSAADAVAYETSRFGQGLLTYSLLLGMRGGALREGEYVDVGTLLNFAVDRVPELARGIGGVQQPMVATPRGAQSFDVGRIPAEALGRIPLAAPRPLVVRARFQDEEAFYDGLGLTRRVNDALREVQARDPSAPLVFVDAEAVEGAHVLVGRYRRAGEAVTVTARIFQSGEAVGSVEVEGAVADLDGLVSDLLARVSRQLEE